MLSKFKAALAVALALPLLNGCGLDSVNQGDVRLVNATSEYSSLELDTQDSDGNTTSILTGVGAGVASGYAGVDKGDKTFVIKGGTSAGVAAQTTGTISTDKHYTVVTSITGVALTATFLEDEETGPASGNAKLRIFNAASTEAGGVDVYLTTTADCSALQTTDTALAANVTGLQDGFSQVGATSAGTTWHVCVTETGDKSNLRLDLPNLLLKDQEIATLILTRTAGGVLLNASVLDQQGALTAFSNTIARVRVVAAAASAGAVSASVNGIVLDDTVASPVVGAYTAIPTDQSASATVSINGVAMSGFNIPTFTPGTDYTLFVGGTTEVPTISFYTDDNTPSTSGSAPVKARLVDGLNGINGTASATVDGKLVGSGVAFGATSSYTTLASSSGTSTVTVTAPGVAIDPLIDQSFASLSVYTIFLLGDATGTPTVFISADR